MTSPAAFKPLSKNDIAELLGVTVRTIENHISAGLLPAPASIGNRRYWHPDVFYAWLEKTLRDGGQSPSDLGGSENTGCGVPESARSMISSSAAQVRKTTSPRGSSADRARARDKAALKELERL